MSEGWAVPPVGELTDRRGGKVWWSKNRVIVLYEKIQTGFGFSDSTEK